MAQSSNKVVVCQSPRGAESMHRQPLGARHSVGHVGRSPGFVNKYQLSTSIVGCASCHASRAACTSRALVRWRAAFFLKVRFHLFNWCQRAPTFTTIPCAANRFRSCSRLSPARRQSSGATLARILELGTGDDADLKAAAHSGLLLPVPYLIDIETTHLKPPRDHGWAISRASAEVRDHVNPVNTIASESSFSPTGGLSHTMYILKLEML